MPIRHKNENRHSTLNNKESANLCEFAGMASHYIPQCWTCPIDSSFRKQFQKKKIPNISYLRSHIKRIPKYIKVTSKKSKAIFKACVLIKPNLNTHTPPESLQNTF